MSEVFVRGPTRAVTVTSPASSYSLLMVDRVPAIMPFLVCALTTPTPTTRLART
jgi:hypothetical protein